MTEITDIHARQIFDSRGNPTVEVDVELDERHCRPGGCARPARPPAPMRRWNCAMAATPSWARAFARRSITSTPISAEELLGLDVEGPDATSTTTMIELDGTPNKARLGANAILGVSLAVAKAAAKASNLPLYRYVGGPSARVCRCR
jgi:enolase